MEQECEASCAGRPPLCAADYPAHSTSRPHAAAPMTHDNGCF
jgi:hypothetical protein